MRGVRRRRRTASEGGAGGRSPAEALVELAGRPIPGLPHDPFRLGSEEDDRIVGGYRVLRLLGRGSRADVYLGRLPSWAQEPDRGLPTDSAATPGSGAEGDRFGLPAEVALKVFHPDTAAESVDREFAALSAAMSSHVVRLLDVTRLADGPVCLLLARCAGGSLSTLLEDRRVLCPGEAVTVLAPILEALAGMHRAGYAHGALRLPSVLFDAVGAPVLVGWGHTVPLLDSRGRPPTPEQLAATPAVADDLGRFAAVAGAVLDRVEGGGALATAIRDMTGRLDVDTERLLSDALFDFAEPLPVALAPPERTRSAPSRGVSPGVEARTAAAPGVVTQGSRRDGRVRASGRHRSTSADTRGAPGPGMLARVRSGTRAVRRGVWVTAGLSVAALILAAALLLVDGTPAARSSGAPVPRSQSAADAPVESPSPAPPSAVTPAGVQDETDVPALHAAIAGDDPVTAAAALLRLRAECIRTRSATCLEGVDQPGSVALAADLAEVHRVDPRGSEAEVGSGVRAAPADAEPPILVQRMGGTAVVSVPVALLGDPTPDTPPASLLMIRSEAGWRIRDVL